MPAGRGSFVIRLGVALTPLAGFLGVIFSAVFPLWLFGMGVGLFAAPVVLGAMSLVTIVQGAFYAWPLTCIILPLVAAVLRPVTHTSVWTFALVGLVGGPLSFILINKTAGAVMHSDSFRSMASASAFAGVILGAIFGFVLWRYDKLMLEQTSSGDRVASDRTLKLGIVLSTAFLIVAFVGLMAISPS